MSAARARSGNPVLGGRMRDLRLGHCMAGFLCRTAALYRDEWSQETRERFTAFVKEQRLDNYDFSRLMVNDELLETFPKQDCTLEEISPIERRTS